MMPSSLAPDLTTPLSRDKNFLAAKPARKGGGLFVLGIVGILLLVGGGLWRASHDKAGKNTSYVMLAGTEIPAGAIVRYTMLKSVAMPKQSIAPGMIATADKLIGKVTRTFIPKGEPILASDIFPRDQGLSDNLGKDERALTLALTDDALLDHAINPGDHVDILSIANCKGKKYTKTICQNVRVLMSMPKSETSAHHTSDMNKITLALAPDLAEVVTEANEVGKLRLLLRNNATNDAAALPGATFDSLMPQNVGTPPEESYKPALVKLPPPPVLSPPPEAHRQEEPSSPLGWVVEVISGDKKEQYGVPKR